MKRNKFPRYLQEQKYGNGMVFYRYNPTAKYISTSYDGKKTKQYQYSVYHDALRQKQKYCTLITLGNNLNKIREDYEKYMKEKQMSLDKIIAIILSIIEICNFRIGTARCKEKYKTYGISTLIKRHVKIKSDTKMYVEFVGKKKTKKQMSYQRPSNNIIFKTNN